MNQALCLVGPILFGAAVTGATTGGLGTKSDDKPQEARERVRGEWRLSDDKVWRITGRVKVLDAHTLEYDDGTTSTAPWMPQTLVSKGGSLANCTRAAKRRLLSSKS
jgi:hypothetical protein